MRVSPYFLWLWTERGCIVVFSISCHMKTLLSLGLVLQGSQQVSAGIRRAVFLSTQAAEDALSCFLAFPFLFGRIKAGLGW